MLEAIKNSFVLAGADVVRRLNVSDKVARAGRIAIGLLVLLLLHMLPARGQESFPDPNDGVATLAPTPMVLDSSCVVAILNRTVTVNDDGTWILPTVPANFGPVRARATCVRNGVTLYGQSDLFTVAANQTVNLPDILLGAVTPVPQSITLTSAATSLTQAAQTSQLTAIATYSDGSTLNVTPGSSGVQYRVSNPAIATVSADGLVTAVSSGTVMIQAQDEGAQGVVNIQVALGGATNGGIPISWIIANFCPNFSGGAACPQITDPAFSLEDPDQDGLTNLQEFQQGTNPNNADTDGDGLTDGQEVLLYHTNPLLFSTDGTGIPDGIEVETNTLGAPLIAKIAAALASLEVQPSSFILRLNQIQGQASQQLKVIGHLIDGKTTLDLTSTADGTNYMSSDLTICNFGPPDGNVFAGNSGSCTITVTNGSASAQATGVVNSFAPTPLSFVTLPGFANGVAVNGNFAYVAAGAAGLQVVNVSDRTNPVLFGSLGLSGNANGVRLIGNIALVAAGTAGVDAIDVSNPATPVLLNTLPTSGTALDLAIAGNVAYVADTTGLLAVNIASPSAMSLLSSLPLTGTIRGVSVDSQRGLAVVAADTNGIYVVDVSNPASPVLLSQLSTGDAHQTAIKGDYAFVADYHSLAAPYQNSLDAVDITNPSAPVVSSSITDQTVGGNLNDLAISGDFVLAADVYFVNGIPITDVTNPSDMLSRAILNFPQRDDNGMGIAADSAYVYLATDHSAIEKFGTTGDARLYIGQFLQVADTFGIAPTVSITSPASGASVVQGSTVAIIANATDDVAVAGVSFQINGQTVFTTTASPYQYQFVVPAGVPTLTFGATAVDFGNNVGTAANVVVNVIQDPGTTVIGTVLYKGTPVAGATVTSDGGKSSTSAADGTFSIAAVPTAQGSISVTVTGTVNALSLTRISASVPPIVGGTTNVGTIDLDPGYVVVTNTTDETVSIIDPSTLSVVATVPIPGETNLYGVSVTSDRKKAVVAGIDFVRVGDSTNTAHSDLFYIDLTSSPPVISSKSTLTTGNDITAVETTSDSQFAVAGNDFVGSFNIGTQALLSSVNGLSIYLGGLAITPDNSTVLALSSLPGWVRILKLNSTGFLTDTGINPLPTSMPNPDTAVVAPNGRFALLYSTSNGIYIARIDSSGNLTLDPTHIPINAQGGVAFTPDGSKAYVSEFFTGTVAVLNIDAQDNVTDSGIRIAVGTQLGVPNNGTRPITIAGDGKAYIVTYSTNSVVVIDTATNAVVATIPVGKGPLGISSATH